MSRTDRSFFTKARRIVLGSKREAGRTDIHSGDFHLCFLGPSSSPAPQLTSVPEFFRLGLYTDVQKFGDNVSETTHLSAALELFPVSDSQVLVVTVI